MMNETIERMARCMHDSNELPGDGAKHGCALPDWSELSEVARSRFRNYARIALMAIREPTDDMCEAGAAYYHDNYQKGRAKEQTSAPLIWEAMIEAALAPATVADRQDELPKTDDPNPDTSPHAT